MKMNLASLASVRTFVKQFLRQFNNTLDILVLNGGIISPHVITEEDQVEKSFLVNYLSHFLLTQLLLPTLEHGEDGRGRVVGVIRVGVIRVGVIRVGVAVRAVGDEREMRGLYQ